MNRPAPFYEATGLPVPPRSRECVGEICPVVENRGTCFESDHHLFFDHRVYLQMGYPYDELVNDKFSVVRLAHCRHNSTYPNSWHNLYDFTVPPHEEVAARFLEESVAVNSLSDLLTKMSRDVNALFTEDPRQRYRLYGEGTYNDRVQSYLEHRERYAGIVARVGCLEVIPSSIVGASLTSLGRKANLLKSRVSKVPDIAGDYLSFLSSRSVA